MTNASTRLFIIPALFLAVFTGLFAYVEFRKISNNELVRDTINDPVGQMAEKVEQAAWTLSRTIDTYLWLSVQERRSKEEALRKAMDDLKRFESFLSSYILADPVRADGYIQELDKLALLREDARRLFQTLTQRDDIDDEVLNAAKRMVMAIIDAANQVRESAAQKHQHKASVLLTEIGKDEKRRALLIVFIIILGFALVIVLLDAVYHYKANAERAFAAERNNALFAAALQNTRVGVLIRDMRGTTKPVVFVNEAFIALTGYAFEDLGASSSEFLFGWNTDAGIKTAFRRAVSLRESATFVCQLYRKDGSPFWCEWHLSPLGGPEGGADYYVSLFNDITAFRQTQEELIQAKSMAEQASAIKTSFLAMMSHEIRTPINGVLGVLKLLQGTALDEDQRHLLGIAKTSSAALHGIINDILDYAKMEAGKIEIFPEPFAIRDLVKEIVDFSQSLVGEKNLVVDYRVQDDLPAYFMSDPSRVRQVLLNLISNAIKFTDSGSVQVRVRSMMDQDIDGEPGYLLRFEVQDTGVGISPDDQAHLFKEFSQIERSFTRRYGGTGLGLAICRRLVMMLGGEIGVESQIGMGSKFWFMLPMRQVNKEDVESSLQDASDRDGLGTLSDRERWVLLVEDNDTNRLVAMRYLQKAGVHVEEACTGVQAIEKAKAKDYDLILMDVSMPEMDGMEATGHIRALGGANANVPIIALTAHVMAGDRDLCLKAGMSDYLNKPIEYPVLVRTLERWLQVKIITEEGAPLSPVDRTGPQVHAKEPPKKAIPVVFDARVLKRMRDDLGAAAVEQVTRVFLSDSAQRILAFKSDDLEVIRDTAHTLKSSSGSCGLIRLSHMLSDLESAAKRSDRAKVNEILPLVDPTYTHARDVLEKERIQFI